jgi:hypothetical protein
MGIKVKRKLKVNSLIRQLINLLTDIIFYDIINSKFREPKQKTLDTENIYIAAGGGRRRL